MYGYRARLIASLISLLIFLFIRFPVPAIIISVAGVILYLFFSRLRRKTVVDNGKKWRREGALREAQAYLVRYDNIWNNLRLSNKFCSLRLGRDGVTITGKENNANPYRTFRIIASKVHAWDDLWDMFCINFSHNKTYDGLVEDCRRFQLVIEENHIQTDLPVKQAEQKTIKVTEKIDINNCSEIELTALPGISVVHAKKIIKKRNEIDGFKTIEDLFLFIKVRPHIEKQLREMICVNKMKGAKKIKRNSERTIDL